MDRRQAQAQIPPSIGSRRNRAILGILGWRPQSLPGRRQHRRHAGQYAGHEGLPRVLRSLGLTGFCRWGTCACATQISILSLHPAMPLRLGRLAACTDCIRGPTRARKDSFLFRTYRPHLSIHPRLNRSVSPRRILCLTVLWSASFTFFPQRRMPRCACSLPAVHGICSAETLRGSSSAGVTTLPGSRSNQRARRSSNTGEIMSIGSDCISALKAEMRVAFGKNLLWLAERTGATNSRWLRPAQDPNLSSQREMP
ncbi:hypothetical protein DFJ73DRAFT_26213 [Zopfochytrium polystomum]|nr:hypothetical protein DFJ73DRAFT_26213 [Zopfochytrium polystomum]